LAKWLSDTQANAQKPLRQARNRYSQEIILEQKEHNRLLLLSKQSQEDMLKALVSHLDQLISNPKDTTLNLEVE
jgi:hypothetical protein